MNGKAIFLYALITLLLHDADGADLENFVTKFKKLNVDDSPQEYNPNKLPRYPVPNLNGTMRKYLDSVEPLLLPEELATTKKIVEDFERGIGAKLHKILELKASTSDNWLADWWMKVGYLSKRTAAVICGSIPALYLPTQNFDDTHKDDRHWCRFTARYILLTLCYKHMIDNNEIDTDKAGNEPLDMSQYKKIFGTCRIPAPEIDGIEFNPKSKHIVVAFKNEFYQVNVYDKASNAILTEDQLKDQLLFILKDKDQTKNINEHVGLLTTEDRDIQAVAYKRLTQSNEKSLDAITKSLFIVCMDQSVPVPPKEELNIASSQLLHGGGSAQNSGNRWFNKIQLIVNRNGINGMNYEHSPAEGQAIATISEFIMKYLKDWTQNKNEAIDAKNLPNDIKPVKLQFKLSNEMKKDIASAATHIDAASSNIEFNVVHFEAYGKEFIKSQRMSPDSFIQMAMQYAFYKKHGVPGAHYESAGLRKFIRGRTAAIRSCSTESVAFAKAMCDPKVNDAEKLRKLRAAVDAHKNYVKMASSGEGVDRHLFGLKMIAIEEKMTIPEFFNDKAFGKSTHFRLATSQVASKEKSFMSYAPAVDDGYGICYNPRDGDIILAVSAFNSNNETSAKEMGEYLSEAFLHMRRVVLSGAKP